METACPDAGADPDPGAPAGGVVQAALIAGAGCATRPGPVPGASVVAGPAVVEGLPAAVVDDPDVLTFLELWLLLV